MNLKKTFYKRLKSKNMEVTNLVATIKKWTRTTRKYCIQFWALLVNIVFLGDWIFGLCDPDFPTTLCTNYNRWVLLGLGPFYFRSLHQQHLSTIQSISCIGFNCLHNLKKLPKKKEEESKRAAMEWTL